MNENNVDTQQLLRDLQQIAIICQRLGIDLTKTAAMGQNIGGKGTTGNSPLQAQNPDHAASQRGGGTGYENLAAGQIVGNITSEKLGKLANKNVRELAAIREQLVRSNANTGSLYHNRNAAQANIDLLNLDLAASRAAARELPGYNQPRGAASLTWVGKQTRINEAIAKVKQDHAGFGLSAERKFNRQFRNIHAWNKVGELITNSPNENAGETKGTQIQKAIVSFANVAWTAEAYTTWRQAEEINAAARLAGASWTQGKFLAAKNIIKPVGYLALAKLVIDNVSTSADLEEEQNKSKKELAHLRGGFMGNMHMKKPDQLNWEPPPLSQGAIDKFNDQAGGEGGTLDYYIDEHGNRHERSWFGKFKQRSLFIRLYNRAEELQKEKEWRYKSAAKAHESANKKAELMDWNGAIKEVNKAKEAIPIKEAQPFFWREPEKYLRSLEACRLAGRNWARSQQPRGASRTGD